MVFSNKNGVKKLRRVLLIAGGCSFLAMTTLVILGLFTPMVIIGSLFLMVVLVLALLNLQDVNIVQDGNKLVVRYYPVFSFERDFETFEVQLAQLKAVEVNKHILGLKWDLTFTIRVQKGIADYPPVSLSAVSFSERTKLVLELRKLIRN